MVAGISQNCDGGGGGGGGGGLAGPGCFETPWFGGGLSDLGFKLIAGEPFNEDTELAGEHEFESLIFLSTPESFIKLAQTRVGLCLRPEDPLGEKNSSFSLSSPSKSCLLGFNCSLLW